MEASSNVQSRIHDFIAGELLGGKVERLGEDEDLLLSGLVDSLGVVRLIAFIEEELGVTVPPEDVTIEHFQTIGAMGAYLEEKLGVEAD